MKMITKCVVAVLLVCSCNLGFAQVFTFNGDKSALPVQSYNGYDGYNYGNYQGASPQYGSLTANFDLMVTGLSVSLKSVSRQSYYIYRRELLSNHEYNWGMTDYSMGFVLHDQRFNRHAYSHRVAFSADGFSSMSNIEIVNSTATSRFSIQMVKYTKVQRTACVLARANTTGMRFNQPMRSPPIGQVAP